MYYCKIERICMFLYLLNILFFSGVKYLIKILNYVKYLIFILLGDIKCKDLFSMRGLVFKLMLIGF